MPLPLQPPPFPTARLLRHERRHIKVPGPLDPSPVVCLWCIHQPPGLPTLRAPWLLWGGRVSIPQPPALIPVQITPPLGLDQPPPPPRCEPSEGECLN